MRVKYRTVAYRKMMERIAKIKAIRPLLDIIEALNHLRYLFLADMISNTKLKRKSFRLAIKIIALALMRKNKGVNNK